MTQPTELVVLINGEQAGVLSRNRSGRLRLEYDAGYEAKPHSPALSLSMPLRGGPYGEAATSRWISSLLPDHPRALERWYRKEGVSSPFGLLASRIGYDCAGAVQFCRPDRLSELSDRSSGLTPLTSEDMAERLHAGPMILRGWGDAYGYSLVASGRVDAMLDPIVNPWDVAPMAVILPEAGGRFTDLSGELSFRSGTGLATNGELHDAVLHLVTGRSAAGR